MDVRSQSIVATALLWCCAAVAEQYTIPLFVAPDAGNDPQGVLRLVNAASQNASVQIVSIDDSGTRTAPATLTLRASAAVQLSATELQSGNAAKGLSRGLGDLEGEVRLVIDSDVPIVPSAYVRGADGALAAMNTTVLGAAGAEQAAGQDAYRYDVTLFHPAGNAAQQSRLRLINPGDAPANLTIAARDDTGNPAPGGAVELTLPAGGARTVTAGQLEAGDSAVLTGQLGAGVGNWQLSVTADRAIQALNVTVGAGGDWRNLSTTAVSGWAPESAAAFAARFLERVMVVRDGEAARTESRFLADNRFRITDIVYDFGDVAVEGAYRYERTGRDSGRLAIDYDNGYRCQILLNFESPTSGWFALLCIDVSERYDDWFGGKWVAFDSGATLLDLGPLRDDLLYTVDTAIDPLTLPAANGGEGTLTYSLSPEVPGLSFDPQTRSLSGTPTEAGNWRMTYRVRDGSGDTDWRYFQITARNAGGQSTTFGVGDTLADLPTGVWTPDVTSGGSFTLSGGNATVELNEGGYIEEGDYRYTCSSSGGCTIENRRVSSGTVVQTSTGTAPGGGSTGGGTDSADDHGDDRGSATAVAVGSDTPGVLTADDVDYFRVEVGASGTLEAYTTGGTDTLGRLEDSGGSVLGTNDDGGTGRNFRLSHDVSAGTHFVRVRGWSSDDTGSYTLHVRFTPGTTPPTGADGDCYVGLTLNPGESCTYPGTDEAFTVTSDGRGRFIFFTSGGSINLQDTTVNGRTYDFAASHQGNGVWRIDRVEGSTEAPDGDDAPGDSGSAAGQAPNRPQNVQVAWEGTSLRIDWDASSGATHYEVWRCSRNAGFLGCQYGFFFDPSEWTNLARRVTETSYLDTNPPRSDSIFDVEIFYSVQACNGSGCSGQL